MTTVVVLELVDDTSVQLKEAVVDVINRLVSVACGLEAIVIISSVARKSLLAVEYPCYRRLNVDLPLLVLTEVELEVNSSL